MRRRVAACGEKAMMRGARLAMVGLQASKKAEERTLSNSLSKLMLFPFCCVLFCVFKGLHCWRERERERS